MSLGRIRLHVVGLATGVVGAVEERPSPRRIAREAIRRTPLARTIRNPRTRGEAEALSTRGRRPVRAGHEMIRAVDGHRHDDDLRLHGGPIVEADLASTPGGPHPAVADRGRHVKRGGCNRAVVDSVELGAVNRGCDQESCLPRMYRPTIAPGRAYTAFSNGTNQDSYALR